MTSSLVVGLVLMLFAALLVWGKVHQEDYDPAREDFSLNYSTLGLEPGATIEEVKAAYKKLARELHPDARPPPPRGAAERFIAVSNSYKALLRDPLFGIEDPDLELQESYRDARGGNRFRRTDYYKANADQKAREEERLRGTTDKPKNQGTKLE